MKPQVWTIHDLPEPLQSRLQEACALTKIRSRDLQDESPENAQRMAEVEGLLISGGVPVSAALLDRMPKLKVISNISVGYNNYPIDAMAARRVIGTFTPDVLNDTVADLVLALMLAVARRVPELDRLTKEGGWKGGSDLAFFGKDVHHATLGLVGMGRIGEAVAERAKFGFHMNIVYHNRSRKPEAEERFGARYAALDDLLAESDFVVLLTPLTPETQGLMGREQFARMKKGAYFINASRGATVDEDALVEALANGAIAGAGLDVFRKEPVDPANPLLRMEQVVALPHIGSATERTRFEMARLAVDNLVAGIRGEAPPAVVPELRHLLR